MLLDLQCEVRVADNGHQALVALAQEEFELVLMDCQMPEMDGYEVTRQIRARENNPGEAGREAPYIIALTANALKGDQERCINAGMDAYISKPIRTAELFETIERFLGKKERLVPDPEHESGDAVPAIDPKSTR